MHVLIATTDGVVGQADILKKNLCRSAIYSIDVFTESRYTYVLWCTLLLNINKQVKERENQGKECKRAYKEHMSFKCLLQDRPYCKISFKGKQLIKYEK